MSNSNRRSYIVSLILLLIFGAPVLGMLYATDMGAISVIATILGIICLLGVAAIWMKKALTNENELENTSEYVGAFSEGLAKAGFLGAASIGIFLGVWFSMPMFMEAMNYEQKRQCNYTNGGNTSLEQALCKLKK